MTRTHQLREKLSKSKFGDAIRTADYLDYIAKEANDAARLAVHSRDRFIDISYLTKPAKTRFAAFPCPECGAHLLVEAMDYSISVREYICAACYKRGGDEWIFVNRGDEIKFIQIRDLDKEDN